MSKMTTRWDWLLGIAIGGVYILSTNCVQAQITSDGTLPNNSTVNINGNIFNITGGTRAGNNLFHSFQEFSVRTGSGALFNNTVDIQNIISRVTGGSISNIDGFIRANGTANLFLINPNGIVFGPNAQLNIGGSFFASTAQSLNFADGTKFSAIAPQTTPLLTISVPVGLQFGASPASIRNQSQLQVQPGKSLGLVGGSVSLDGGLLQALNGRVELAGVAGSSTVGLSANGNDFSLNVPQDVARADISLTNGAKVDVADRGLGSIALTARNIDLSGGSRISAGIGQGLTADSSPPGNITLNGTGIVTIGEQSRVTNLVNIDGTGNAGDINIKAGEIFITNQGSVPTDLPGSVPTDLPAALDTGTFGKGHAGNISLDANGSISLIGQDVRGEDRVLSTTNEFNPTIDLNEGLGAGNISLKANGSISLLNAYLKAGSKDGDAGNISLIGDRSVSITGNSSLFSGTSKNAGNITIQSSGPVSIQNSLIDSVGGNSAGNSAGDIKIFARSVSVTGGAELTTRSFGGGKSGNIEVNATDLVEIAGKKPFPLSLTARSQSVIYTSLLTTSEQGNAGITGDITINTGILHVLDGANLRAESKGTLRGGNIKVNANVVELTSGGQLFTTAFKEGNAGDINLNVTERIVINGSDPSRGSLFNQIVESVDTDNANLGDLIGSAKFGFLSETPKKSGSVIAQFMLGLANSASGVFASTSDTSTGRGGNIEITTGKLQVQDSGQINVNSAGQGNAGSLKITANSIFLDTQGTLQAVTTSGNGGDINLQVGKLLQLRRRSLISATAGTAQQGGDGGNITINAPNGFIVSAPNENSDITANAYTGTGGNININSLGVFNFTQPTREDLERELGTDDPKLLKPERLHTNDITAFSQINPTLPGQITIKTSDVDASKGLAQLPTVLANTSKVIADTSCGAIASTDSDIDKSKFTITGRGGLPPSPNEPLTTDVLWLDTRFAAIATQPQRSEIPTAKPPSKVDAVKIVPATGWVFDGKGNVTLISNASNANGLASTPAKCGKQ